ncbi:MAG: MFS transporter, partial [Acidimicrobiia bacterium]|nr:MFS transporter [Acidimicrobiia bacterium]
MQLRAGQDRRVFLVACFGGALSALDSTLNIAFPAVVDAFEIDVSSLQWVIVSYVLTYAALLLPFGRLADHVGRQRVMGCGLAVSAIALTACGVATTFPVFLAARIAQGVGIALVLAAAPALITLSVPEEGRARALGLFQMSIFTGFAAGPVVGGILLEVTSWRAVFLFRVPVVLGIGVVLFSTRAAAARGATASPGAGGRVGAAGTGR